MITIAGFEDAGASAASGRIFDVIEVRILRSDDVAVLRDVAPGVFDSALDEAATREFLSDTRHHLAVALDDSTVVGMITAVHYIHPDKPVPELWINELGVALPYRRRGIGRKLVEEMLRHATELGCTNAWVLTGTGNENARQLYAACGGSESAEILVSFPITGRESV